MAKKPRTDDVRPPRLESACTAETRDERGDRGLGSIAGGWDGSDELVRILEESPRIGTREIELP
jgi:hypothetical protein